MFGPGHLVIAVSGRLGQPVAKVLACSADAVLGSTGKATAAVCRLHGEALTEAGQVLPWNLVVKTLRAPSSPGDDAAKQGHWSYWRREALAYESALLPHEADGLACVECYGAFPDAQHTGGLAIALQPVEPDPVVWSLDHFARAAARLGRWQASWKDRVPPIDWLARDQLRQRIARTDAAGGLVEPDWSRQELADSFPAEARAQLRAAWRCRWSLIDRLTTCPSTLTHGDFSRGNLLARGGGGLVVIDWAALGVSPVGFDLAHLVLSAADQLDSGTSIGRVESTLVAAYLEPFHPAAHAVVRRAFDVTVALTACSRLFWSLVRTAEPHVVERWARLVPWILAKSRDAESGA